MQDADDVLGRVAPQRHARHRRGEHRLDRLLGRQAGVDHDHLGAVDHHVGDGEVAQVEQAAEHVAILLLDAALAMQEIDRAAQLLVRREHRLVFADPEAERSPESCAPAIRPRRAPGVSMRTTAIDRARRPASAMRSGESIAAVFGSTSQKTTISTVMMTVA